ncbi:MAG: 5-bromo-4-chloroindolyl phosphate hydrolysis family protein [Oscillospiraceae bacterium]|nr:5-bromo-4-chloroindolyl phosphate hydrolysis family protein [Oscillospiraceae bacterium]
METVKRKSTVPYYACGGVWLLYAVLFPLYKPSHFLLVAAASALVFALMRLICPDVEEQLPEKPREEELPTGNEELDRMIREGGAALAEMKRLNESISDPKLSADIDRLEDVCGKIFAQVRQDPSRLGQIRKFMDYYLPTTLKILGAYGRMGAQGVSGENIDGTMQRVESMMGTIVSAFEKQLDSLFGTEAMDITTDITVLENLMRREGLVSDELHDTVTDTVSDGASGGAAVYPGDVKLEL